MANKQTKRERKELAKKQRLEAIRRQQRRRRLQRMYGIATVLIVLALIGGLIWLSGRAQRQRDSSLNSLARAAGCEPLVKKTEGTAEHVAKGTTVRYSVNPPTSGNHDGSGTASTGVHDQPIPNELQVHNLEHGHIGIQYKPEAAPKEVVEALKAVPAIEANKQWVFMAPKPDMPPVLAFTAWGKLVACNDAAALTDPGEVVALANEFIEQYRDKSPRESVPGTPLAGTSDTSSPPPSPSPRATSS